MRPYYSLILDNIFSFLDNYTLIAFSNQIPIHHPRLDAAKSILRFQLWMKIRFQLRHNILLDKYRLYYFYFRDFPYGVNMKKFLAWKKKQFPNIIWKSNFSP